MSNTRDKHTVAIDFVRAALAHLGEPARSRALDTAGIPAALLGAPQARVPAKAYAALWLAVARELDDEFFGLDQRRMKVGSFALLCQALVSCPTLERALKRLLRGFAVLLDDIGAEIELEGDHAVLRVSNRIADADDRRFADETLLILVHGLMCWLVGRRIALQRADFAWPRPSYAQEHRLMYCDDIRYSAAATALRFDVRALAWPVVQDAGTLKPFLRSAPQSVILKYRNEHNWTARVRRRLRGVEGGPGQWPAFDALAAALGTTPSTLRRRLEGEGANFQRIKDRLRNDLAIDCLCNGALSVDEIAARLGFQEPSAFHRAFKRWNGLQPGEYRRQHRQALTL